MGADYVMITKLHLPLLTSSVTFKKLPLWRLCRINRPWNKVIFESLLLAFLLKSIRIQN